MIESFLLQSSLLMKTDSAERKGVMLHVLLEFDYLSMSLGRVWRLASGLTIEPFKKNQFVGLVQEEWEVISN